MSANNPFPEIPVTVPQIIRQAGHRTYQRGVTYQRNREVIRYSYDEDEHTLTGLVNGSTIIPYEVTIHFFPAVSGSATFTARCTCPVLTDCKHAVALMLTALDRASVAKKALSEHPGPVGVPATNAKDVVEAKKSTDPLAALRASGALTTAAKLPAPEVETTEPENPQGSFALNELGSSPTVLNSSISKISAWRRDLSSVLSARQDLAGIDSMRVSGALDFSLCVSGSYARGRNMPGATPSINLLQRGRTRRTARNLPRTRTILRRALLDCPPLAEHVFLTPRLDLDERICIHSALGRTRPRGGYWSTPADQRSRSELRRTEPGTGAPARQR